MTAGAHRPISAIAAGDSAVTPRSRLDNDRRCENAAALRIIKMAMNRTKQKPFHLSSCFNGLHNKNCHPSKHKDVFVTLC